MEEYVKSFYACNKDIWGQPQNYRGVLFYPIRLDDTESQSIFYLYFQIPKKYIKEPAVQELSYLRYLIQYIQYALNPTERTIELNIAKLLGNITGKKCYFKFDLDHLFTPGSIKLFIGDTEFGENEFDIIREIVLLQNASSTAWVEEFFPYYEEKLLEVNKSSDNLTMEEEIFKFCTLLHCPISTIKDYTLYQFYKHFQETILLHQYGIYYPLELTGELKSQTGKEIVRQFLSHAQEKGRYGSILIPWKNTNQSNDIPEAIKKEAGGEFDDFAKLFNK